LAFSGALRRQMSQHIPFPLPVALALPHGTETTFSNDAIEKMGFRVTGFIREVVIGFATGNPLSSTISPEIIAHAWGQLLFRPTNGAPEP